MRRPQDLRKAISGLSEEERSALVRGYDIVGDIAILEISPELAGKEHAIAQAVLHTHKHVKTVLAKREKHGGEFRTRPMRFIAGEDKRETLVRESGCSMLIDVERVYYSVRLSTERLRIAALVQPGEEVLVLFSGAGPYVCVIAKHSKAARVVGVEKNPLAHEYALSNVRRNALRNADVLEGDAALVSSLALGRFDRIILMYPSGSLDFVASALEVLKDNGVLHVYAFAREEELPALQNEVLKRCAHRGCASVERVVRAGHQKPYVYRWCLDVVVGT